MLKKFVPIVLLLVLMAVTLPACSSASGTGLKTGYHVGNLAPDFTLFNLTGQQVSLSSFLGRPVVLNFWATD